MCTPQHVFLSFLQRQHSCYHHLTILCIFNLNLSLEKRSVVNLLCPSSAKDCTDQGAWTLQTCGFNFSPHEDHIYTPDFHYDTMTAATPKSSYYIQPLLNVYLKVMIWNTGRWSRTLLTGVNLITYTGGCWPSCQASGTTPVSLCMRQWGPGVAHLALLHPNAKRITTGGPLSLVRLYNNGIIQDCCCVLFFCILSLRI